MQPLNKTFTSRNKNRIGLITLPYCGNMKSLERVTQFCADDILKIEYNTPIMQRSEDRKYIEIPTYARITTKTKGDTYCFFKSEWPEGTDKAISLMYSRAMDGHDVDFRDYLLTAAPQPSITPPQLPAPQHLESIPTGRIEYKIDPADQPQAKPQPFKPLPPLSIRIMKV